MVICFPSHLFFFMLSRKGVFQVIITSISSVTQSCPILSDPVDCSMTGLPVHHQLLEFTQTHAHWVGDAIQPSHPLSSSSPPVFNLSQHQGLFKWVSSSSGQSIGVSASASILPMNTQDWFPLPSTGWVVMSSALWFHGLPHNRLPCPSLSPGVCSNSCQLSWSYYPTILSSVGPFSSCAQSFPASGSFPMSQLFAPGGQIIGVSSSA